MMYIYHYRIPKECYPRYSYTCKFTKPLLMRYKNLLKVLDLQDDLSSPSFGDIDVFYLCEENTDPPENKHVCLRYICKVTRKLLTQQELEDKFGPTNGRSTHIFLAPCSFKAAENFMGPLRFFIGSDTHTHSEDISRSETIAKVEDSANSIEHTLERALIESLLDRLDVLACFMERGDVTIYHRSTDVDFTEFKKAWCQSALPDNQIQKWLEQKKDNLIARISRQYRNAPKTFREQIMDKFTVTIGQFKQSSEELMFQDNSGQGPEKDVPVRDEHSDLKSSIKTFDEIEQLDSVFGDHLERLREENDAIEQLFGEMKGMVYRSKVPVPTDRLLSTIAITKRLEKEVAQEILQVDGVTSVGYRFRTLDIFLDNMTDVQLKQSSEEKVKLILQRYEITLYRFRYEQREITHFHQVGETVNLKTKKGPLGGFAKLGQQEALCVLLSKHLANYSPSVYIESPQHPNGVKLFAHVLPPRVEIDGHDIDIAIARVIDAETGNCDELFRDEDGIGLPSKLCLFNDHQWLSGLPVHIWRGNSRPGLGIISHPVLYRQNLPTVLLQVEDREPDAGNEIERFAEPGDSGSIICASDPDGDTVHVLAMLIGSPNASTAVGKRLYTAFRLVDGLDHLQHEQKASVVLC